MSAPSLSDQLALVAADPARAAELATLREAIVDLRRQRDRHSASSIRLTRRNPLALTKWPWEERTGSRYTLRASIFSPRHRSRVSSIASWIGSVGTRCRTNCPATPG